MNDKPLSKSEQIAALRISRADRAKRPKTSPELEAAFAVLLPKAKSSGGGSKPAESLQAPVSVRIRPPVPKMEVQASDLGKVHRLGPPDANPCPVCAARRRKKADSQKKWRQKETKKID